MVAVKYFRAWLTLVLGFLLVWSTGAKAVLDASTKSSAKVNFSLKQTYQAKATVCYKPPACLLRLVATSRALWPWPVVQMVQVYADGSLSDGWHDSSEGCMKCTWASTSEARTGSKASFSAVVAAWGSLILASDKQTYPVDSVLDFWAKGSGLASMSLYFGDSATNMYTSDVRFTNINESITTMSAPDAIGWYHIQIKISKLTSTVTKFDRIILVDVSGLGYHLVLDDISVVPTELAIAASNSTAPSILPVFGQDRTARKLSGTAPHRHNVKLKKDAKIGTQSRVCQEQIGNLSNTRRFQGACESHLTSSGPVVGPLDRNSKTHHTSGSHAISVGLGFRAAAESTTGSNAAFLDAATNSTTILSTALRTVQAAKKQLARLPPVDVVYAWVNGSDPNFIAKYKQSAGEPPACNRVQNNNEVLMALLAICKHQPWVHHVYIVVDQQTFDLGFLRPACQQKTSFVDLTQIVPAEFLPTFNSHTFETFLYRIPGLSDYFIYLNDDMLMSRPIDPASLFIRNKLGFRFKAQLDPSPLGDPTKGNLAWQWPRVNGRQLFQAAFNSAKPKGYDAHSAYLLRRVAMQKTWKLFSKQLKGSLHDNKVRRYTNITDGGDVHFTSLSQQVGIQLGLQVLGHPILTAGVKHHSLASYLRSMFYGKWHVVCLQDLMYMNDAGLKLLCNMVSDLWCASACGEPEQQARCKKFVSMCSHRPRCFGTLQHFN